MPLGAPNTPLHTGWWCLQHHRSCRAQGRGGSHTHRRPQRVPDREHPWIYTAVHREPQVPTQPSPLSCRPPGRRNCIALREPPWGPLCQAPSPPTQPHFGTSARHTAARVGTLPPRLLWLGVEEGDRRLHPPPFPQPFPTPTKPTPARTHPHPQTHTYKAELPRNTGNKEIVRDGSRGSGRERTGSRDPTWCGGKTGTTATLVQLERVPTVRDGHGGEGSPQLPWAQSQASQGRGLAGVSMGQGWSSRHPPPSALCPPGRSDSAPLTPSGQQQPQSQYLQVIHGADPPHPSFLPSLGFGRFSRGWVGRRESSKQTLPSLPPSSQTTGLGPQRLLTSALAQHGSRCGGRSHHDQGKGCFAPSYKVGFKLGRMGPHRGLPRRGFLGEGL